MKKKILSGLQILIMIASTIAFAYIFSESTKLASAQTELPVGGCCKSTSNGATCLNTIESECSEGFQPNVRCEDTSDCKQGCCVNSANGECNVRTPKAVCEVGNGRWVDNDQCSMPECLRGCCVIGTQTQFVTERTCKVISDTLGLQKDFRKQINTEMQCLALSYQTQEGSCVYEQLGEQQCRFITQQECKKISGASFQIGKFCSDALPGQCIKQDEKKCVDGKDPVYWFDSCGNKESIAEPCDRFTGTTCGLNTNGNAYCKDLDCHNIPDNINGGKADRKNGESWCVYESAVGHDLPGTRHYKLYCIDGEAKIEPCAEARADICVEDNSRNVSAAACRTNLATMCLDITVKRFKNEITDSELREQCAELADCESKNFNFGSPYTFSACMPKYTRGFANSDDTATQEGICNMGTLSKKRIEQKKFRNLGEINWHCEAGCLGNDWGSGAWRSDYPIFFAGMQSWCESLGDCGANINLAGEVARGGVILSTNNEDFQGAFWGSGDSEQTVSSVPITSIINFASYQAYKIWNKQDVISPGNFSGILRAQGWPDPSQLSISNSVDTDTGLSEDWQWLFGSLGLTGLMIPGLVTSGWGILSTEFSGAAASGLAADTGLAVSEVLISAVIGGLAGYWIADMSSLEGQAVDILVWSGVVAGVILSFGPGIFSPWGAAAAAILGVIAGILQWTGLGETRTHTFTYVCQPYEPPQGGANCEQCATLGIGRCTKYKCESLGAACFFEDDNNDGLGECVWENRNDVLAPSISPLDSALSQGVAYSEVSETGFKVLKENGQCFNQFEKFNFGISTNKRGTCLYGLNSTEISSKFKTSHLYDYNHTLENLNFASQKYGDVTLYVKCANINGKESEVPFLIRSCVTEVDLSAPQIAETLPETGSYLKYGEISTNLTIYTSEPAKCKWSKTDEVYASMENSFTCTFSPDLDTLTWPCQSHVTNIVENESHVYVRCEDYANNTNAQSYDVTLHLTEDPLSVEVTQPTDNSEVVFGQALDVELDAETSGGVNGNAKCTYSFSGYTSMIPFFNTGYILHNQKFSMITEGSHRIYIECRDEAGNEARTEIGFTVRRDRSPPQVTRTYKKDATLFIETNEDSTCRYSFDDCSFDFAEGIDMTGPLAKEHQTPWKPGKTFYIKCGDLFDNIPDDCSIRINTV